MPSWSPSRRPLRPRWAMDRRKLEHIRPWLNGMPCSGLPSSQKQLPESTNAHSLPVRHSQVLPVMPWCHRLNACCRLTPATSEEFLPTQLGQSTTSVKTVSTHVQCHDCLQPRRETSTTVMGDGSSDAGAHAFMERNRETSTTSMGDGTSVAGAHAFMEPNQETFYDFNGRLIITSWSTCVLSLMECLLGVDHHDRGSHMIHKIV